MTNKEIFLLSFQTGLIKEERISVKGAADYMAFVAEHVSERVIDKEIRKGKSITDLSWEALEYFVQLGKRPEWLFK